MLQRRTDAIGNVTEYLYDADLQQIRSRSARSLRRAAKRGAERSPTTTRTSSISETDALGNVRSVYVRRAGNVVAVTDANGNTTNFEYDRNNRLLQEIRPADHPVSAVPTRYTVPHQYDANGNEIATTDENGTG